METSIASYSNGAASGALIMPSHPQFIAPVATEDEIIERQAVLLRYRDNVLKADSDYGVIPGTGTKPTLLKPGAEKLCTLFGLTPRFSIIEKIEDWNGTAHNGEPFFYYLYECSLFRGSHLVAQSHGSCNSWEKKYRYRNADRLCPHCSKDTIKKSKMDNRDGSPPGWYCFGKIGGCGAQFAANDPAIMKQETGQKPNPDIADAVNTLQKMGQKRALVAATLIAVNASEFFTQDIEDFHAGEYIEGTTFKREQPAAEPARTPQQRPQQARQHPPVNRKADTRTVGLARGLAVELYDREADNVIHQMYGCEARDLTQAQALELIDTLTEAKLKFEREGADEDFDDADPVDGGQ